MGTKKLNRDLALKVLDVVGAVRDALDDLLETMFIIYQPKDVAGVVGDTVTLTVVAMNVVSYQWMIKRPNLDWANSTASGATSDTLTININSAALSAKWHCVLTDADGNTLTTNDVEIIS